MDTIAKEYAALYPSPNAVDALGPISPLSNIVAHLFEQRRAVKRTVTIARPMEPTAPATPVIPELAHLLPRFLDAWRIADPEEPEELYYIADKYEAYLRRYHPALADQVAAAEPELLVWLLERHFSLRLVYA